VNWHVNSGRPGGRANHLSPERVKQIHDLHTQGFTNNHIARVLGISSTTVSRRLRTKT